MKFDIAKLYATQISLTEWFARIGHKQTETFRQADNEKREYLEVLREELGVQYDKGIKLNLNEKTALRLIPLSPNLPKLRIRGKTIAESMRWFAEQKIDDTKYRAELIPHVDNAMWSTIFVINRQGIFGEIIKGNHHQLTQGFHVSGKPIRFSFDFKTWKLHPTNPPALKHLKEIMGILHVPNGAKQSRIKKRLAQASFIKDYLQGYFETIISKEHGLWFSDYNTLLADAVLPAITAKTGGTPTSAGVARGIVGKEILVCKMTTPQDLPLMMKSKGIITEMGGILSHAAIICRELKKPCITNVANAVKKFKPGTLLEMNGETGEIKII